MTSPKHLWSGDWEQDSADAAAARADLGDLVAPIEDEDELEEPVAQAPPRPKRPKRPSRQRTPLPRPRTRLVVLSLLALLVVAAGAYAVTALGRGDHASAAASTPWLGAKLQGWPGGGALVTSVSAHSPAAAAGLQPGDVIREVEGRPVGAPVDVTEAVDALRVGDALEIQFERNSKMYVTSAVLKGRPSNAP